ncbi:unnamed protein product [Bursaphelenchus okinawaensis]|uniref:Uncharacterized protein n=1 Tax=Bursaphelenchus okinawaensis TaxID=465554 RepID=A0A811LIS2_9BILA|nr:unnamed protein product [Bursaphelenchus okinawaensis]CAG9124425.1 unnamed protein product [Bursaphelenchus okinawaensis]
MSQTGNGRISSSSGTPDTISFVKSKSQVPKGGHFRVRYHVTILVLITMGVVEMLAHYLFNCNDSFTHMVGAIVALFMGFFAYEWVWIHSPALTRNRKAHFDEANILETYQPRARTMGHMFTPDPPTPGPTFSVTGDELPERSESEKAKFNAVRNNHYENMYQHAIQVAKEQEEMEKKAKEGSKKSENEKVEKKEEDQPAYENLEEIIKTTPKSSSEKKTDKDS